jgi:hypothetical protein
MDIENHFSKEILAKWQANLASERETNRLNNLHISEAVQISNALLTNRIYKNKEIIKIEDVHFTDNFFGDGTDVQRTEISEDEKRIIEVTFSSKRRLSNILFNIYYPNATESEYYHFTKLSTLKHILKGELKLNPLVTNANFDEFKTFYIDHDILGYFQNHDYDGKLMKETLMRETYAFCMASKVGLKDENERALWGSFADGGGGVRIEFGVKSNHPDFRKIFYKEAHLDLEDLIINRLNRVIRNLYKRQLFISGISKIGAFYLPGDYKIENEVRFVVKKHTDQYGFHYDDSKGYIILPFDNLYATFTIKKIKMGPRCSEEDKKLVDSLLKQYNYSLDILEV